MSKHYLVTGGTGFIGSATVKALVNAGFRVRSFDNNWRGREESLADVRGRVELVEGDIRDPQAVRHAVEGVDSVLHLAAINGTENFYSRPALVFDVAVKGALNIIDACESLGVTECLMMSSSEVYQTAPKIPTDETAPLIVPDVLNPRYSYGGGKIATELAAVHHAASFKRMMIVRPHNVYGPAMGWEHVVPQMVLRMKGLCDKTPKGKVRFPIQGNGQETRAFAYVSDMIDGLMAVLEKGQHRGIYHVGTDVETSIASLAAEIAAFFGREIELEAGPLAPGGTARRCPDIAKVRKLGFRPRISLRDGIAKTAAWYVENASRRPLAKVA